MKQYLNLLQHVLDNGVDRSDRTGTGTRSVFGHQMRFSLSDGFPVLVVAPVLGDLVLAEVVDLEAAGGGQ